jgi:hypothetical protein
MPVLNTISPEILVGKPNPIPSKIEPSWRISLALVLFILLKRVGILYPLQPKKLNHL